MSVASGLSPAGSRLYAVLMGPATGAGPTLFPTPDFVIVLATPAPPGSATAFSQSIDVKDGRIVRVSFSCGQDPEARVAALGASGFLLPPP